MCRASTAAAAISWAAVRTLRPEVRSMSAIERGRRARARTVSRPMCLRSAGRSSKARVPSSQSASRAVAASARSNGIGLPNATHTGVGISRGDFHRYLFPAKENTEPQRPSMATGTTGTRAFLAISSYPFRIAISWPVREISPSGNTQTSSPCSSALTASRSHCKRLSGATTITPALLNIQERNQPVPGPL